MSRMQVAALFVSTIIGCVGGGDPIAEEGSVGVQMAALDDADRYVKYDIAVFWAPQAGAAFERLVSLTNQNPNQQGAGYRSTLPCRAGRAAMVEVTARIYDRQTQAQLDTIVDGKVFQCVAGQLARVDFSFQTRVKPSPLGGETIRVSIEDVELSLFASVEPQDDQLTASSMLTYAPSAGRPAPDIYLLGQAKDALGGPLSLAYEYSTGKLAGDRPASFSSVSFTCGTGMANAREVALIMPGGAADSFQTAALTPTFEFIAALDGKIVATATAPRSVAIFTCNLYERQMVGAVRNISGPERGGAACATNTAVGNTGFGCPTGGIEILCNASAKPDQMNALHTQVYGANPTLYPNGIVGTGAMDFGEGEFGVLVEGTSSGGNRVVRVAWCAMLPGNSDGVGATTACKTDTGGFLDLHTVEDSLNYASFRPIWNP